MSDNGFMVIIPAAGRGERSGRERPKQYENLLGESILRRSVLPFSDRVECLGIVVVINPEYREEAEGTLDGIERVTIVNGGERRQDSVLNGLAVIPGTVPVILVHDAARPCLPTWLVDRIYRTALRYSAAIPGVPVVDTLKEVDPSGRVIRTIPREGYRLIQTPQGFTGPMLREAYRTAEEQGWSVTDEAGLLERAGEEVIVVEGDPENLKVTHPEDFRRAEDILRRRGGGRHQKEGPMR